MISTAVFWLWHGCDSHKLLAAVITFSRSVQDQDNQHSSIDVGGTHKAVNLTIELSALDGCLWTGIHSFKDNEKMAMLPQITLYPCSFWGTTNVAAYFEAKQKRRTLGRSELEGNFWGKLQRGVMGGYDNSSMNICRKLSDNNERINPSN